MRKKRAISLAIAGLIGLAAIACAAPVGSATEAAGPSQTMAGLPSASAEDVGMSGQRLGRLAGAMEQLVDERRLAGITTAVARHGKVAFFGTFGQRDIEANAPMSPNAIFRIYSMSKPITGVALMILYEEGRFRLSDPVAKYIPEFANLQVAANPNGTRVEKVNHPITIRELMTHTAGFTYGSSSSSSSGVDAMYLKKQVLAYDGTLRDMITRLANIPLRQQPGTMWHYSVAVDVQGYLVEVLSGQKLDVFLQKRLFEPLNMLDTGFYVPKEKANRLAQIYVYGKDGGLIPPSKFDDSVQIGGIPIRADEVVDRSGRRPGVRRDDSADGRGASRYALVVAAAHLSGDSETRKYAVGGRQELGSAPTAYCLLPTNRGCSVATRCM